MFLYVQVDFTHTPPLDHLTESNLMLTEWWWWSFWQNHQCFCVWLLVVIGRGSGREDHDHVLICSPCRIFLTMTRSWNSMWMLRMVWSWRAICSREPAMLSRPGTGKEPNLSISNQIFTTNPCLTYKKVQRYCIYQTMVAFVVFQIHNVFICICYWATAFPLTGSVPSHGHLSDCISGKLS